MAIRRSCFLSALCLGLLLLAGSGVLAADRPSLAIFQIETRGADVSEQEHAALGDYLDGVAADKLNVQVTGWRDTLAYLRTKDLYLCMDRRCQMDVEKALKVDYSLAVAMAPMGKICLMNAVLYPSQSPASIRTAMYKGPCGAEKFVAGLEKMVSDLAKPGPLPKPRTMVAAAPRPQPRPAGQPPVVQRPKDMRPSGSQYTKAQPVLNDDQAQPKAAGPKRRIDGFPRFQFTGGLIWAPAPLLLYEKGGESASRKVPDHYGPQVAFEWRFASYLLLGGQVRLLHNVDGSHYDASARFGTLIPLTDKLAINGRFDAGMSSAQLAVNRSPDHFSGLFAELGLGLRYFFSSKVGLFFELGGNVVQLSLDEDSSNKVVLLRLQSNLGLVVGW